MVIESVLFLRTWIRSGVNVISDLRFIDGKLDENFVFRKIKYGNNLWQEIFILKNALLPYREYLCNITMLTLDPPCLKFRKSKDYYNLSHETLTDNIHSVTNYLAKYYIGDDASYIYKKKIILQKESKQLKLCNRLLQSIFTNSSTS